MYLLSMEQMRLMRLELHVRLADEHPRDAHGANQHKYRLNETLRNQGSALANTNRTTAHLPPIES